MSLGVEVLGTVAQGRAAITQQQLLTQADSVVALLGQTRSTWPSAFFELGRAAARQLPLLVLVEGDAAIDLPPELAPDVMFVPGFTDEVLGFHLDLFVARMSDGPAPEVVHPVEQGATDLIAAQQALSHWGTLREEVSHDRHTRGDRFEAVVQNVLTYLGGQVSKEAPGSRGFDVALSVPAAGRGLGIILVEANTEYSPGAIENAALSLQSAVLAEGADLGLLLWDDVGRKTPRLRSVPRVVALGIGGLVRAASETSLADALAEARQAAVENL